MTNENQTDKTRVLVEIVRLPWSSWKRDFSFRIGPNSSYRERDVERFLSAFEAHLDSDFEQSKMGGSSLRPLGGYRLCVKIPNYEDTRKESWEMWLDRSILLENIVPKMNEVMERYNRKINQGEDGK